jgi:hypothetical protein
MTKFYFPTHVVWLLATVTAYTHSVQFGSGTRAKGFVIGLCITKPQLLIHIALLKAFSRISSLHNSLGSGAAHKSQTFLLEPFAKLQKATINFVMSVRIEQFGTSGRTFIKFDIWIFFEIYRKNHVSLIYEKNNGYLRKEPRTFLTICCYILLKMRNFSDKIAEKIKTHYILNNIFFFGNLAVYEIMWKNMLEPGRPQMTIYYSA